jgi:hypothetical protein
MKLLSTLENLKVKPRKHDLEISLAIVTYT